MSVNAWVGLVIVVVPIGMLLIAAAAMGICRLLFGDQQAERGSRTPATVCRQPGLWHH
jgi:hypothetical protein